MNNDNIIIRTNSKLKDIVFEDTSEAWHINFENEISISIETFWRLFDNEILTIISKDHNQQFGLSKPVDLIGKLKDKINNKALKEIKIEKNTGDLTLTFDNNIKLIAYISSMGYESYFLIANGRQYVAQGGGDIEIFEFLK